MAEIKHTLSLLRNKKRALFNEVRRLVRMLARLLPHCAALVLAPRSPRRATRSVTKFEIGGNITRSVILALPNVHLDGINFKAIVGGIVITVVIVNIVTSTTPNPGKNALQAFVRGDAYHLDVLIAPFRAVNPSDKACDKFAQDFTNRLARTVTNNDPQNSSIWMPEQVAGVFAQGNMPLVQFAEEHQVDVLFYGDIECDDQKAVVRPHVVAPALFYRGAPEMADFYNFDDMISPLLVALGDNSLERVTREQAARISTVIDIGRGFRLLATNSASELQQASTLFQHLAEAGGIADRHGLAMLQYLIGKTQIAGVVDACNTIDQDLLRQAENSFSKALLHEPEFALALAYLGNVSFYKANVLPEGNTAEIQAMLNKSLARYQRALETRVQPADGLVMAVAMIGKAQAKIALHDVDPASSEGQQMLADAAGDLYEVIRKFDSASANNEIKASVALAYALLGDLHRAGFNDERALSSYGRVASLTNDRWLQAAVAQSMAELYTVRGDACAAARQYQLAAQNACQADSRKLAAQAAKMQFFCQQTNDSQIR